MLDAALFESIAEESPDGIVLLGVDGLIQFWNRTAEAMFGHHRSHAIGQRLHDLILRNERDEGRAEAWRSSSADTSFDTIARCADGSLLYVNVASRHLHHRNGEPM